MGGVRVQVDEGGAVVVGLDLQGVVIHVPVGVMGADAALVLCIIPVVNSTGS